MGAIGIEQATVALHRHQKCRDPKAAGRGASLWEVHGESPVVIVVLGILPRHQKYHLCDPHNAVQNMLLAAHALGLGTCWVGVRDTPMEDKFRDILGVPRDLRVVCAFPVGHPAETAKSSREPLEKIVSYERYRG